jgi:hypothetical protein
VSHSQTFMAASSYHLPHCQVYHKFSCSHCTVCLHSWYMVVARSLHLYILTEEDMATSNLHSDIFYICVCNLKTSKTHFLYLTHTHCLHSMIPQATCCVSNFPIHICLSTCDVTHFNQDMFATIHNLM